MKIWLAAWIALGCGQVSATRAIAQDGGGGGADDSSLPAQGGSSGQPGAQTAGTADAEVAPSSGCLRAPPPNQIPTVEGSRTGYTEFWVETTGAMLGADEPSRAGRQEFFVRLPAAYDDARPYRVVYLTAGCGSLHAGATNTYPLFDEAAGGSEEAIYVGVSQPENDANPGCPANGRVPLPTLEAFELMHGFVESHYCVDNQRIYIAGHSSGALIANAWGCYFGGVPSPERKFSPRWAIRGHAGVAGSLPQAQPLPCNGPSAGFFLHDALDMSNRIATDVAALELQLKTNGCTGSYADGPSEPWAPAANIPGLEGSVCRKFTGCPAETSERYPLVFCTTSGQGHGDQAAAAIPAFTRFFEMMEPAP